MVSFISLQHTHRDEFKLVKKMLRQNLDCFRSFRYVNTIRYHFRLPHIKENICLNQVINQTTKNGTLLPSFYSKIWIGFWFNKEPMERTWFLLQNCTEIFQNSSALKRLAPFVFELKEFKRFFYIQLWQQLFKKSYKFLEKWSIFYIY